MSDAPQVPTRSPVPGRVDALVVALACLASGAGALVLGQDLNFDLLSYHSYNGYALLEGRLDRDLAPAGWHTYINPLLDGLFYAGMAGLPARVFGFLLGALQGLNAAFVYLIALASLAGLGAGRARALAVLAAILCGVGPNARSLLGTTMGNNLVSLPVLGALLVLVWPLRDGGDGARWSGARLFAAAALSASATGLRLTVAGEHLALFGTVLVLLAFSRSRVDVVRAALWLGLGSATGVLVTAGHWGVLLWQRFGNPVFPFGNQLFRSPWFASHFFRDTRYMARDAWDYLRPPVDLALGRMERLQEIGARDGRFLVLFLLAAAALALAVWRRGRTPAGEAGPLASPAGGAAGLLPAGWLVLGFWFAGYALWAKAFYYYRYMTTLELLAPVALLVLLAVLLPARRLLPVALVLTLGLAGYVRTDSWGRGDWQENWFGLELPALARRPGTLVLIAGAPVSFALPYFPEDARFAHLTAIREKGGTELFARELKRRIDAHRGPLLLLAPFRVDARAQDPRTRRPRWSYNPEEDVTPAAREFGLALGERCEDLRTRRLRLYLCEVERAAR